MGHFYDAPHPPSAVLSQCGAYRYWLTRDWTSGGKRAVFIMLNPSTADAIQDDPTIRRCIDFAKRFGCDGLLVVNLYALRSTDPDALWNHPDPVGPENDAHIQWALWAAEMSDAPVIAAWGANARQDRVDEVLELPGMLACQALGLTKAGQPRHPLYLRRDAELVPWPNPEMTETEQSNG